MKRNSHNKISWKTFLPSIIIFLFFSFGAISYIGSEESLEDAKIFFFSGTFLAFLVAIPGLKKLIKYMKINKQLKDEIAYTTATKFESRSYKPKSLDNTELALQLFNSLSLGMTIDDDYADAVNNIRLVECPDQKSTLLKVIELANGTNTPKQRYVIAMAYSWLGAKYRRKAIEYIELYLSNELYTDLYKGVQHAVSYNLATSNKEIEHIEKCSHLSEMYEALGKAYEGEYEFENALKAYSKANKIFNYFPQSYTNISNVLVKMNRLDLALETLQIAKQNKMYGNNDNLIGMDFAPVIHAAEQDIKNKITKGYIYRPRNRK